MSAMFDPMLVALIVVGGAVTLFNRLAGHYILTRFEPISYRLEAALEAVPVAVMTTLVVPTAVDGGPVEWLCLLLAIALSFRFGAVVSATGALVPLLIIRNFV